MKTPERFPYMISAEHPWHPPRPPQEVDCPHAAEGERVLVLRPGSRAELLQATRAVGAAHEVRCLLLALPEGATASEALQEEDLCRWAGEAEARLQRPVGLLQPKGRCLCGQEARCRCYVETRQRETRHHLETLALRAQSLATALAEALPTLTPREHELLHAWALRADPSKPSRPIGQAALAESFHGSIRSIQRTLARARQANPRLLARLEHLRNHRLRHTGAWEVR